MARDAAERTKTVPVDWWDSRLNLAFGEKVVRVMDLVAIATQPSIRRIGVTTSILLISATAAASPPSYSNKQVDLIQPDHPSSNCFYFILQGVGVADPAINSSPWFAVDRTTHKGAAELYATLLAAKASGLAVDVWTSGAITCGYASVSFAIAH